MSRPLLISIVLCYFAMNPARGGDVAKAIGEGRAALQSGRLDEALQKLQGAVPAATSISEDAEKAQALSALHFYSALAFYKKGEPGKTREQLEQFFRFTRAHASLDASKFDRGFLSLFQQMADRAKEASTSFDRVYPGFREAASDRPRPRALTEWPDSAEYHFLATSDDKRQWKRLRDDTERSQFVTDFWSRRDPNPDTSENELETSFLARAAFADRTWGTEQTRGSLTDRGRVFVLLGKPQVILIKGLTRREGATIENASRNPVDGTVERWIFSRDQLPKLPQTEIVFKFITEPGYGEHVMQKDFFQLKALAEVARLSSRGTNQVRN